ELGRATQLDGGLEGRAEAVEYLVALGMRLLLVRLDEAEVEEVLHLGMVHGARKANAPANPVETGIARMGPPGAAILDDAGDHRGARRLRQAVHLLVAQDLAVAMAQAAVEKPGRVVQRRPGRLLEVG